MSYTCEICGEIFENGRVKSNHVRWKHRYTDRTEFKKKMSEMTSARYDKEKGELMSFTVTCKKCNAPFIVKERERLFPSKDGYFCSRACANSHHVSDVHRKKTSDSLRKLTVMVSRECPWCHTTFESRKSRNKIYCSMSCAANHRTSRTKANWTEYQRYRHDCKFRFALSDFPDEFDFSLITTYGWYKAKNRGDNPSGVSRDHIVSVRWGYENGVDPTLIRHPANCQLLRQSENVSKGKHPTLTVEELIKRVDLWDKKYQRQNGRLSRVG